MSWDEGMTIGWAIAIVAVLYLLGKYRIMGSPKVRMDLPSYAMPRVSSERA
jgi:hypothetical protein